MSSDDSDFEIAKKNKKNEKKTKVSKTKKSKNIKETFDLNDSDSDLMITCNGVETNGNSGSKKRLSVERIYQKKSQLEHILLRPDTYIGSVEFVTQQMWVYDNENLKMVSREISYVPGLYKIFDEILVNAADNKQRDKKMDIIKIEIDPEKNMISVYNNGKGVPVIEHKDEKVFVPTLIFGHLLTSSNYNDEERKVTGGRNGYGAKLCNIFSKKFIVETSSKENKQRFYQCWEDNMTKTEEPKITSNNSEDFTKITFYPDLSKFKMEKLDKDIVDLISRRAFDVAGSTFGVKVYLNGTLLKVKGFKDYIDLYLKEREDDNGQPLKIVYEKVNERWEIGLSISEKGFQQVSFVNSIATTKGGRHVDYIVDQVVSKLSEAVKKKNKQGVNVKPFQLKNHIWLFVNCLIENPTFDSQTKENMTLQAKSFGSKCVPSEKFFNNSLKIGIVESILTWVSFKAQSELAKQCTSKKTSKLKNLPKLDDANDAGTRNSIDCTLILTEGDSAKTLVIAGLGVVGRDKYGCFPLRGKMLNVREATHKQILENVEINNIIKILGLQYKKKYDSIDDLKTLRYGRLMIMTDQDQDGSHIKGLLINFIHHNWPSLLKLPFLEEFITPIVKVTKKSNCISFYSLPEFNEWKANCRDWKTWNVKYYKGLGTSSSNEAKDYFSNLQRNRIKFKYEGPQDDQSILLAFSKKMIEDRKEWLTNNMEDRKRRKELGLPEIYLYEKDTKAITYKDFINKELILFSNADNERSIPSLMDGLKPGQRKVLFTCFKRNDTKEIKVAQLAGSVGEKSAYHHGEASLQSTIIGLAQNFVGSNNISLLEPRGQFGTRLQGGKDSASPRYIFTLLSPLARKLFPVLDDPLLTYLYDDNQQIEPEYYVPIIPMVLANGATGIGTGWSTNIPNYNPRDLVENIKRLIKGEELIELKPWFKNFKGSIIKIDEQRYITTGNMAMLEGHKIEITELPIRVWTQTYKENILETYVNGSEKVSSSINEYKEYHTDETVRFVVSLSDQQINKVRETGFYKFFKLQSSLSTASMVLFDHNGVLRKYDSPNSILIEFYEIRKEYYRKRKKYLEGLLEAESCKLNNQARFILENIEENFKLVKLKEEPLIQTLISRGYNPDPIKDWKKSCKANYHNEESDNENEDNDSNYNYLLDMNIRTLLPDNADRLIKKRDEKQKELYELSSTQPETFWLKELDEFLAELDKFEKKELESSNKTVEVKNKYKSNFGSKKYKFSSEETKPSLFGEKIEIDIEFENVKKSVPKSKINKQISEEIIEDEDLPLSQRIGTSPEIIDKSRTINNEKLKQTKLDFKAVDKILTDDTILDEENNRDDIIDLISPVKEKKSKEKVEKQKKVKLPKIPKEPKEPKKPKELKKVKSKAAKKDYDSEVSEIDFDKAFSDLDNSFKNNSPKQVDPQPTRTKRNTVKSKYTFSSTEDEDEDSFISKKQKKNDSDSDF